MKIRKKRNLWLIIMLLILFVISMNLSYIITIKFKDNEFRENNINPKLSFISSMISINGNQGWQDFKDAGNCIGNGTPDDPYIIRDLEINGNGTEAYCIYIRNSDVYFMIENCNLHNATNGIRLINVNNAYLKNNTCYNNVNGISITSSNNSTITNCIILNNQNQGINVQGSNITIENNSVTNSFWGISVTMSTNCKLSGNKMIRCGLFVLGISYNAELGRIYNDPIYFDHLIGADNYVNGKHLYYYKNEVNLIESNFSNAGQIILYNCSNTVIQNLNLSFTTMGLQSYSSQLITVDNLIANNNSYGGIFILEGSNNTIKNNIACYNNDMGIVIASSSDNTISNNYAMGNKEGLAIKNYWGIGSNYNQILNNIVEFNSYSGITIQRSKYNDVRLNEIYNNQIGIYLDNCYDTMISLNCIDKNTDNGIYLYKSENNIISDNLISNTNIGILLKDSENNVIVLNSFNDNYQDIFIISTESKDNFIIPSYFILLIIILLICITSSILAITVYKNFPGGKKSIYSSENIQYKDQKENYHKSKSSKEILSELTSKDRLLLIFDPDSNSEMNNLTEDTLLSAMSEEFLKMVDLLKLNEIDKREFLKEMFSFKPSERLDIVNRMLLKINSSKN